MDWADEMAQRLLAGMRYRSIKDENWDILCNQVAGALRNAKAGGVSEAGKWVFDNKETCGWSSHITIGLHGLAQKIERGEA